MKKSHEFRSHEIKDILKKLNELELSHDVKLCPVLFPEIKEFYGLCKEYIQYGNKNIGKIRIESLGRDLVYEFHNDTDLVVYMKAI